MNSKKKIIINIIVSTIVQFITLILGFILPRVILLSWGSEYNGLINAVTTIMRYLSILEAGINTSTLQALYKAIGKNDGKEASIIVRTAQKYYQHVSIIYTILVIGISLIYPIFLESNIDYWEIVIVIILQGLTGVINYSFRAAYIQLLNAEGKYYIISVVSLLTTILTYAAKIVAITVYNNIIIMQLLGVLIMIIQSVIYFLYFKKKYTWLDKNAQINMTLLKNRQFYVVQQIAGLVFNSTDTLLLSVFCGLKIVSVYTIYNMVYSAFALLIGVLRSSTNFVLGQAYHKSTDEFKNVYDIYTSFQTTLGCFLSSCSIVLILSFVKLYTEGITDINYINYSIAILFSLNSILDCVRGASLSGSNISNQAPKTTWRYVVEATTNLTISLLFVKRLEIVGVLLGTFCAGLWRSIDSVIYFNNRVLNRKAKNELIFVCLNIIVFCLFAIYGYKHELIINSYLDFFKTGIIVAIIAFLIYGCLFFVKNKTILVHYLINRKKDNF